MGQEMSSTDASVTEMSIRAPDRSMAADGNESVYRELDHELKQCFKQLNVKSRQLQHEHSQLKQENNQLKQECTKLKDACLTLVRRLEQYERVDRKDLPSSLRTRDNQIQPHEPDRQSGIRKPLAMDNEDNQEQPDLQVRSSFMLNDGFTQSKKRKLSTSLGDIRRFEDRVESDAPSSVTPPRKASLPFSGPKRQKLSAVFESSDVDSIVDGLDNDDVEDTAKSLTDLLPKAPMRTESYAQGNQGSTIPRNFVFAEKSQRPAKVAQSSIPAYHRATGNRASASGGSALDLWNDTKAGRFISSSATEGGPMSSVAGALPQSSIVQKSSSFTGSSLTNRPQSGFEGAAPGFSKLAKWNSITERRPTISGATRGGGIFGRFDDDPTMFWSNEFDQIDEDRPSDRRAISNLRVPHTAQPSGVIEISSSPPQPAPQPLIKAEPSASHSVEASVRTIKPESDSNQGRNTKAAPKSRRSTHGRTEIGFVVNGSLLLEKNPEHDALVDQLVTELDTATLKRQSKDPGFADWRESGVKTGGCIWHYIANGSAYYPVSDSNSACRSCFNAQRPCARYSRRYGFHIVPVPKETRLDDVRPADGEYFVPLQKNISKRLEKEAGKKIWAIR